MGLLSLAIWLPVAVGTLLLIAGRDEHAGPCGPPRWWARWCPSSSPSR